MIARPSVESPSAEARKEAPTGASFRWRAPCGDVCTRAGDALRIEATSTIAGLEASSYRKSVLLFFGERFVLVRRDRLVYELGKDVDDNLYVLRGELVAYEPERHLEQRRERRRVALGFLLWVPMVPLMPVLGLLPQSVKDKLIAVGFDPGRATRMSLGIEWLLLFFALLAYAFLGGFFSLPGLVDGAITLLLALDIAYRVTADGDNQSPGMFGVVRELIGFVRGVVDTARGRDRLLPDDTTPPP